MTAQDRIKVPVRRGRTMVVGVLTPPIMIKGRWTRWTGVIQGTNVAAVGDTAAECADALREVAA